MFKANDIKFMKIALKLSKKGLGFTEPNPLVGAVLTKNGSIIASGFHRCCGDVHAERAVLEKTKEKDTTLYVTLEPCDHQGKTPPCTGIIIDKGVKRVVIAMQDPNPLVNGKGIEKLQKKGITVDVGFLQDTVKKINRHYLKYITQKLPYVTIKAGVSMDGKLTDKYRKSQWITGPGLRELSQSLRGEFSAILAGVKTVIDDDPQLTLREEAWEKKRLYRVILDSRNILDKNLRIFREQERFPLILFSAASAENKEQKVENHFFIESDETGLDLDQVLKKLYKMDIASVLVEGGGKIIDSFLSKKLYDEVLLFTAGKLIGGREAVELFPTGSGLSEAVQLKQKEITQFDSGYLVRGFKE